MLLTGVDNHLNGLGNMRIIMDDNQFGKPGYEGGINNRVETVSSILQRNGYSTYMSGKWHLGMQTDNLPVNRGFDQSISLMETGADNWEKSHICLITKTCIILITSMKLIYLMTFIHRIFILIIL